MRALFALIAVVAYGMLSVSVVHGAQVLLQENFDTYSTGSLDRQGQWVSTSGVSVFPLGSMVVQVGGQGAVQETASRRFDGGVTLDPDGRYVLACDAYAFSISEVSHDSGAYLGSQFLNRAVGWRASQDPGDSGAPRWVFDASGVSGLSGDWEDAGRQFIGTWVELAVVVDGERNELYGRLQALSGYGGAPVGQIVETRHYAVSDEQIAAIDRLVLMKTPVTLFNADPPENRQETGALFDDFQMQRVPEPGSCILVIGVGACLLMTRRRRH